ncbi:MAG TPA: Rieske 2Fe-2S domain-containing protein [Chloroflexota bacterium]|nr:Rieske 2Fe-2S domain-containing protein [Chloroflexota bacterium]
MIQPIDELVRTDEGMVSARIFADPEIYRIEMERLYPRCWLFVAHESEIPNPGDFVTRHMGADPVIVSRDAEGKVRVLLNVCRHRGRKVCTEDAGRATHFRCGYHGWTYSSAGQLTGLPFADAYQGRLDRDRLGLCEAAGVDTYHGLIFACWEPQQTLREYLGDATWALDIFFGRTDAVEVVGPPVRWLIDANWKFGSANFSGDGTHIFTTHGFSTQLGLHSLKPKGSTGLPVGYAVGFGNGHCASFSSQPEGTVEAPFCALPESLWPELERHLGDKQRQLLERVVVAVGTIFPNFSFLETAGHTPEEWGGPDRPMSFLTMRQWQPKGPDKMEALTWLLMDRNTPEEWKADSRECYERVFGVAGLFEQDDVENWAQGTRGVSSPQARKLWLQYRMGLGAKPSQTWFGPGIGYARPPYLDALERFFYERWRELITN